MNTETLVNFFNLIIESVVNKKTKEKKDGRGFEGRLLFLSSFFIFVSLSDTE